MAVMSPAPWAWSRGRPLRRRRRRRLRAAGPRRSARGAPCERTVKNSVCSAMKRTEDSTAWRRRVSGSAHGSIAAALRPLELRAHRPDQLGEQRLLVLEVPVEEPLRDAGRLADVDDRGCWRSPATAKSAVAWSSSCCLRSWPWSVCRRAPCRHATGSVHQSLTAGSIRGDAAAMAGARPVSSASSTRQRNPKWQNPPLRIEMAECINCDACLRHCPPQFGAIFNHGPDVVIIPELCSGCDKCLPGLPGQLHLPVPRVGAAPATRPSGGAEPLSDNDPYA